MKNTAKLSDIGARTMHVVRFVRRFFFPTLRVFIARKEFSPARRRVQLEIKLFRVKCVVEDRKRLTLK